MHPNLGNTNILMYDFFNTLSVILMIIFNFSQLKYKQKFIGKRSKKRLENAIAEKKDTVFSKVYFWAILETLVISVFQFSLVLPLNNSFGDLCNTGTNYFGTCFFLPVILIIVFAFLGISPFKQLDLITPTSSLTLITIKLACFCGGCCEGIQSDFGFYNYHTELVEFPVQLVESALALLIFIFIMFYRKKAAEGTLFPIFLMAYSGTRFFSEFLRAEPDVLWKLKTYHFLCIVGLVVGITQYIIIKKYNKKIELFIDKATTQTVQALLRFAVSYGLIREKKVIYHHRKKKKHKG